MKRTNSRPTPVDRNATSPRLRLEKPKRGASTPKCRCYRCNESHPNNDCRFKDYSCRSCGKQGHITRACRNRRQRSHRQRQDAHCVEVSDTDSAGGSRSNSASVGNKKGEKPAWVQVTIKKKETNCHGTKHRSFRVCVNLIN